MIKLIIILISIIININPVFAQFTGYGNDQSYQSAITLFDIDKLPPIKDKMSYETKFSYIYVDSIARACNQNYVEHFPVNCSTDSLKFLTSICSNIHSFDEALLRSYTGKTSQLMLNDSIYQSCPIRVLASTSSWVKQYRMKEIGIQNAFLSFMPYIYHIVVDSVLIGLDSTFNNEGDIFEWVNVSATILDIIKGNPPCNCKMAGGKYDSFLNDSLNKSCINFGYPKDNPTKIGFDVGWGSNTTLHTLKKGEELIVFLKGNSLNDKDFIVIPSWFYEETGGLFMIKDGYVIDSANFWGSGNLKSE